MEFDCIPVGTKTKPLRVKKIVCLTINRVPVILSRCIFFDEQKSLHRANAYLQQYSGDTILILLGPLCLNNCIENEQDSIAVLPYCSLAHIT